MEHFKILNEHQNFAIMGIVNDTSRYAYKIYRKLKEHDKTVYGINPKYEIVDGDKIYPNIKDVNQPIDVAVFVVNPKIGIHMLDDVKELGIKYVWLQPGSADEDLVNKAEGLGLTVIQNCVLAVYALNT